MDLHPLSPVHPLTAAAHVRTYCLRCSQGLPYHKACEQGWQADRNGPAFAAYYCPACVDKLRTESAV